MVFKYLYQANTCFRTDWGSSSADVILRRMASASEAPWGVVEPTGAARASTSWWSYMRNHSKTLQAVICVTRPVSRTPIRLGFGLTSRYVIDLVIDSCQPTGTVSSHPVSPAMMARLIMDLPAAIHWFTFILSDLIRRPSSLAHWDANTDQVCRSMRIDTKQLLDLSVSPLYGSSAYIQ